MGQASFATGVHMLNDRLLQLAVDCAHLAALGGHYEEALVGGVLRLMSADAGVGLTCLAVTPQGHTSASVLVAEQEPLTPQHLRQALDLLPRHPLLGSPDWQSKPIHRMSDYVNMPRFWDDEVWWWFHGFAGGRYPVAVILEKSSSTTVFLGAHRQNRDFTEDDLTAISTLLGPMPPALAFRDAINLAQRQLRSDGAPSLTHRETQVLALAATGRSNREVARLLTIGERTVRKHLQNAYSKLAVSNRTEAAFVWRSRMAIPVPGDNPLEGPRTA